MKEIYALLSRFDIEVLWITDKNPEDIKGMQIPPHPEDNLLENKICIGINPLLDLKERVITFFHELLHYDWKREREFFDLYGRNPETEKKLEDEVENESYSIYNFQPRLVNYIISKYHLNDARFGRRF